MWSLTGSWLDDLHHLASLYHTSCHNVAFHVTFVSQHPEAEVAAAAEKGDVLSIVSQGALTLHVESLSC
jgi:hypothetical protein